jgi:hypothetical protein
LLQPSRFSALASSQSSPSSTSPSPQIGGEAVVGASVGSPEVEAVAVVVGMSVVVVVGSEVEVEVAGVEGVVVSMVVVVSDALSSPQASARANVEIHAFGRDERI